MDGLGFGDGLSVCYVSLLRLVCCLYCLLVKAGCVLACVVVGGLMCILGVWVVACFLRFAF